MGIIICQHCDSLVSFYKDVKVSRRYGICPACNHRDKQREK